MRIAVLPSLIAPVLEGACFGGAEMAALALAEALAARAHEVYLIGLPGSSARGARVIEAPRATLIFRPGDEPALGAALDDEELFRAIFAALPELDVLHLHLLDPAALFAADRYARANPGVRVIATLHLAALFPRTVEAVARLATEATPIAFTAPSRFAAESWNAGVAVVPNGIEVEAIRFFAEAPVTPRLAWAGRRSREKGLIEAMAIAELARIPLAIAGAAAPEGAIAVNAGVEDLGVLPREKVPEHLFGPSSAVLVTSTIPESFSLVAAEALSSGTPVIAFDLGALREVVEHGVTGLLVPPGDLAAAADAARTIARNELARARCRDGALRFRMARAVSRFEQLYVLGSVLASSG